MNKRNLTGLRFGRLTVIRETSERAADGGIIWECLCDCGKTCFVCGNKLTRKGHSQKRSCGCLQEETHHTKTHGESKSVLFHKWTGMKDRCYNSAAKNYKYYGGEGITVCDEWRNSYEAFRDWALSAGYESGLSLDRIDPHGNYCPDNCRWVSLEAQQRNKRSNINVEINGDTKTLAEWARIFNMPYPQVWARINHGWDPQRALTEPIRSIKP